MSDNQTRVASLSLDLDNKWSYMKTHGNAGWESFPGYFDVLVPRVLDFLRDRDLKISFFIVGQDAALKKNAEVMNQIGESGHEVGNHSFRHEPWLHLYSEEELDRELAMAEEHIVNATGQQPEGFRGPGFSLSERTLRVLVRRGYRYDATIFPNLLNPVARIYFFATSNLSRAERQQRKALFGTWRDALRPVKPFRWNMAEGDLLEIPVTTMPLLRVPIHLSYVIFLSSYSEAMAVAYVKFALAMCRLSGTYPSILMHPLDFLGQDDTDDLAFFPGMNLSSSTKMAMVSRVLDLLGEEYSLITMREHADLLEGEARLRKVEPVFR
jgi:peptidoglycan/xylan/chitin deacetylase (PgdA/CDA1 family)